MYRRKDLVGAASVFVIAYHVVAAAANDTPAEPHTFMVYPVSALPVWRVDSDGVSHFDPSLLITHIKATVAPDGWRRSGRIATDKDKKALLILQTSANHDAIGALLRRLYEFADHNIVDRMAAKLTDAKVANEHVLIFAADPHSELTDQFFSSRFDNDGNTELRAVLNDYRIQCVTFDQAEALVTSGVAGPHNSEPSLSILRADGGLIATTRLETPDQLQPGKLVEFLRPHRPTFPDAMEELDLALAKAAAEEKLVLSHMSGPNCYPCIELSRYLANQKGLLSSDYVILGLDSRMHRADKFKREFGRSFKGFPWMVILSPKREVLATSGSPRGNIGYPAHSADGIEHFRRMLFGTRQRLSKAEIDSIVDVLRAD